MKGQVSRQIHYAHIAKDGKPGASGLPPRLWADYPSNYQFQDGTAGAGSRLDVVLMPNSKASGEYIAYYCKVSHIKADARKPGDGVSNTWWGMMDGSFSLLCTKLILAQRAFVRNLIAENIVMLDENGNEIFVADDGEVRCNKGTFKNVKVSGTIQSGDPEGQHILLDPEDKAIRIFDASGNECATLDGSSYNSSSILPAAALTIKVNPEGRQTLSVNASQSNMGKYTDKIATDQTGLISSAGKIKITLNATLSLSVPQSASPRVSSPIFTDALPIRNAMAALYCIVTTVNSAGTTVKTSRTQVLGANPYYDTDGTLNGVTAEGNRTFTVSVPPGKHRISFLLVADGCTASASYTLSLAQMVQDSFMARYFSNGLGLTHDTLNYMLALYESNVFKLMLGGDFYIDKVKQPKVVYAARVTDTSANSNTACTTKQYTYISSVSAVKQSTEGVYRFVFPAAYGLTVDNMFVSLTGYGASAGGSTYPVKATVKSISMSSGNMTLDVWVSDDDSPNYGGFYIEVKKY